MIFVAKNEKGEPTWKLAQKGIKTVTRRMKPMDVGKEFAIQPGRGKFAVCRATVISCVKSNIHYQEFAWDLKKTKTIDWYKESEAKKEGFNSWDGLMQYFQKHDINFMDAFRIEFKLLKNEGKNV